MEKTLKIKLDKMLNLSKYLIDEYKWAEHQSVLKLIALEYVLNNNTFDKDKYEELQIYIKSQTNILYNSSEYQRTATAAIVINKYENPKKAFDKVLKYEEKMENAGFKKGYYLAIAVYALMNITSEQYIDDRIDRAINIYKDMKKKHFWFTKDYNYPIVIILSKCSKPLSRMAEETEECYKKLYHKGIKRRSGLQILSYILLLSSESIQIKSERCKKIIKFIEQNNFKIYSIHYSIVGILALTGDDSELILKNILEIIEKVNKRQALGWVKKEIDFFMIAAIVIQHYIDDKKKVKPVLSTGVEAELVAFIAEQTAIMVSASFVNS